MDIHIIGFDGSSSPGGKCTKILKKALAACEREGAYAELVHLQGIKTLHAPFNLIKNPRQRRQIAAYLSLPGFVRKRIPESVLLDTTDQMLADDIRPLIHKMEKQADGFIFASQVHWSMPTGYMKNFIDYLTICDYRGYTLRGKPCAFISTCNDDGAALTNMLMMSALVHMGAAVSHCGSFWYNRSMRGRSEENWQETDQNLGAVNVVRMCKLYKGLAEGVTWDWNSTKAG